MDGNRFDALIRAVTTGAPSRRTTLRLLAGGGLALLTMPSEEAAGACARLRRKCGGKGKKRCCAGSRCRKERCVCKPGRGDCDGDGLCENLKMDGACPCAFAAELNGQNEVPEADPDGTGDACVDFTPGQVCWRIRIADIALPVTGAHIHEEVAGANGPIRIDFLGKLVGCKPAPQALINAIKDDPDGFYVNIHNGDFPNGAIRGQLAPNP